ncbi:MAG: hypothetical protein IT364_09355 [Candidatus Hydrogenedentes bacterium]|nr:hypothetical protein [Candidatus Hydrogenedentota bacterium]
MKYWQVLPIRTKVLFLILFLLGVVYVYSIVENKLRTNDLAQAAQREIASIHSAENELTYEVTVTRQYILLGRTQGKVQVYVRQKPPRQDERIHAVSFYYNREGGQWKYDGSGADAGEEIHERGLRMFARQGPAAS